MTSPAWKVDASKAEDTRRRLWDAALLDETLRVRREGGHVLLPLRRPPTEIADLPGELVEAEFAAYRDRGPRTYQELLDWPPERRAQLPRSFDVVGDIVLLRLPEELRGYGAEVGAALLTFVPGARLVVHDDGVKGRERTRTLTRLAGTGELRTVHRENGISFEVDVARAYFSPRLGREHARVAERVAPGERVFDLCCGVGPFALAIARRVPTSHVVAVDANPVAIELLEHNRRRLGVEARIEARCEDLAAFLPRAGVADRVILNLPHEGIKYLTSVGKSVGRAGSLHYYEVTDRSRAAARSAELVALLGGDAAWESTDEHEVHPYSPKSDLRAYGFRRRAE